MGGRDTRFNFNSVTFEMSKGYLHSDTIIRNWVLGGEAEQERGEEGGKV